MPGFIKTPADEHKWSKAKEAAGKSTPKDSDSYYKLANYIFHKGEIDPDLAKAAGMALQKQPGTSVPSTSIPNPAKVGNTAVKMPKTVKQPDPFGKPSLFFKAEQMNIKHPSIDKLRTFLENRMHKRQS